MSEPPDAHAVELDRVPPETFRQVVVYLDDVLRECQLVLVSQGQGRSVGQDLADIASGLVPDIEAIADAFRTAHVATNDDGTLHLRGVLTRDQAALIASLQLRLVQIRQLGRRGALLLESDPIVIHLMVWIWEELSDQLAGRPARPYLPAT